MTPFGPNIWIFDGAVITGAGGFHFPTRMVVTRLNDGDLWVHSPVALSDDLKRDMADLGPVTHIVAPNSLHDTWVADWAHAYPAARIYTAPKLAAKLPDIPFVNTLGDVPEPAWTSQIEQVIISTKITDEVVFFHHESRTVIFTDLLQQMPRGWFPGWRALVARLDLMVSDAPQVPRKFRLALGNRAAARTKLAPVMNWPIEGVVMAHGVPIAKNGKAALASAFRWVGL